MSTTKLVYDVTGDQAIKIPQAREVNKSKTMPWWGEYSPEMYPRQEHFPKFPDSEFERRHDLLREVMRREELECFLIAGRSAVGWVSGYFDPMTNVGYVIFPLEGEPILIENFGNHTPTAKALSYIKDIREAWRVHIESFVYHEVVADALKEFKVEKGTIGICGWDIWEWEPRNFLPALVKETLMEEFPKAKLRFFDDLIIRLARVHSPPEIAFIEKASEMLDLVFYELAESIKPGMKECEVWGIVKHVLYREGGDDPFSQIIVSHPQAAPIGARQGATAASMRTLHQGDIITGEYTARYGGYCAQNGHPISIGPPMKEWKDLYDIGVEGLYKAVDKLRPGNTLDDTRKAGMKVYKDAKIYGKMAGHLMGIQVERIGPNEPLEAGMTVALHSWPFSRDYSKGHFIGDTWLVTDGAPRKLNQIPEQFFVV